MPLGTNVDNVAGRSLTSGTGSFVISDSDGQHVPLSTLTNGETYAYKAVYLDGTDGYETGTGVWTAPNTLSRTPKTSSNANALVPWSGDELFIVIVTDTEMLEALAGGSGGHVITEDGSPLTARANLDFSGTDFDVADNSGDDSTDISLSAAVQAQLAKTDYLTVTQPVDLDQMETDIAALANGMVYKGDWDASSGGFPGSGSAQTGWFYYVSVAGTVDSIDFAIGDNIVATTDSASATTYSGNWSKHDQTDAVQSVAGLTGSVSASSLRSALNVEDGADVTDTTNVTAAGALMDSEVSSLSGIKTLTVPDSTTISAFAATLTDDTTASAARTTLGAAAANNTQTLLPAMADGDVLGALFFGQSLITGGTGTRDLTPGTMPQNVNCYDFRDDNSSTTANDSSGNYAWESTDPENDVRQAYSSSQIYTGQICSTSSTGTSDDPAGNIAWAFADEMQSNRGNDVYTMQTHMGTIGINNFDPGEATDWSGGFTGGYNEMKTLGLLALAAMPGSPSAFDIVVMSLGYGNIVHETGLGHSSQDPLTYLYYFNRIRAQMITDGLITSDTPWIVLAEDGGIRAPHFGLLDRETPDHIRVLDISGFPTKTGGIHPTDDASNAIGRRIAQAVLGYEPIQKYPCEQFFYKRLRQKLYQQGAYGIWTWKGTGTTVPAVGQIYYDSANAIVRMHKWALDANSHPRRALEYQLTTGQFLNYSIVATAHNFAAALTGNPVDAGDHWVIPIGSPFSNTITANETPVVWGAFAATVVENVNVLPALVAGMDPDNLSSHYTSKGHPPVFPALRAVLQDLPYLGPDDLFYKPSVRLSDGLVINTGIAAEVKQTYTATGTGSSQDITVFLTPKIVTGRAFRCSVAILGRRMNVQNTTDIWAAKIDFCAYYSGGFFVLVGTPITSISATHAHISFKSPAVAPVTLATAGDVRIVMTSGQNGNPWQFDSVGTTEYIDY